MRKRGLHQSEHGKPLMGLRNLFLLVNVLVVLSTQLHFNLTLLRQPQLTSMFSGLVLPANEAEVRPCI
jgi:hypothetical protein